MKQKAFFIIFKGLSLKSVKTNFLKGESLTLHTWLEPFLFKGRVSVVRHVGTKVMSNISLLLCFLILKGSTSETRKNVLYFTSKALFLLEILKF